MHVLFRACINSQAQPGARQHGIFLDHQTRLRCDREEVVGVGHVEVFGVASPLVLELAELWVVVVVVAMVMVVMASGNGDAFC